MKKAITITLSLALLALPVIGCAGEDDMRIVTMDGPLRDSFGGEAVGDVKRGDMLTVLACETRGDVTYLLVECGDMRGWLYAGFAESEYAGRVTVSAYYPGEDGYHANHRGQALSGLVGTVVAVPTGHEWLGRELYVEGVGVVRAWDTGCKPGRIDLLVQSAGAMEAWGLRECGVWVLGG